MVLFAQYYQRAKNVIHAIQALAIFVAWAMTIAILTKGGNIDGRIWYYFTLCWSCIPTLIYQTASPVFQRIRRFSSAYVHAVIDVVYTIFWLAAFACLIAWVEQGSHAAKDWKSKDSLCEEFAWGPVSKCKLGQDAWIVALIICLLFAVTAAFSIYGVSYYRKNGSLPEYFIQDAEHLPIEDQDFSADTSDKFNGHEDMQLNHSSEVESPFPQTDAEEQTHSSGPVTWNLQRPLIAPAEAGFEPVDTSYYGGGHPYESSQQPQSGPTFQYPANGSRYDTHHSNESQFVGGLKPSPMQIGGYPPRQDMALDYDHGGYASSGRLDFPEGHYGR